MTDTHIHKYYLIYSINITCVTRGLRLRKCFQDSGNIGHYDADQQTALTC